ncbi:MULTISPECIES: YbaK/EbsC family protein [unclassified Rhizobium]|uniref:YbaK/EbsC family protein n=1 Tax=unclassified Rhizobium TaxID=2613769 RepID=UPI0016042F6E|nr:MULTISPECIES: YbaK/EbsC family protein [unclassified Rhizobium]MBB1248787.1 YbaK/EbsC family protein [Rhizobium sp. G21]MCV3766213.1 YbaK/EbsC family protein [Rhizobium sp. TRM95796]
MSLDSVKQFFRDNAPDIEVIELSVSTATVELAAAAHGVEPGQIAKTLAIRVGEDAILLVTMGTARLDNKKFKARFAAKPRMLALDEVTAETSHPVGGVCPFGLPKPLRVYCDISLRDYAEVVPAAGDIHAAVRISPERMAALAGAEWVDVCQ